MAFHLTRRVRISNITTNMSLPVCSALTRMVLFLCVQALAVSGLSRPVKHVVMFSLKADATPAQHTQIQQGLVSCCCEYNFFVLCFDEIFFILC